MTPRERLLSWIFWPVVGGLLLGTSYGRAFLTAPIDVGVLVPRWASWSAALLVYLGSLMFPWRAARVAIGFAVMHAFTPPPLRNPLPWSLIQEASLLLLVLLSDVAAFPSRPPGPDRPRRTPAAALRAFVYSITAAAHDRRRIRRAS
jgi:hypothetical protein